MNIFRHELRSRLGSVLTWSASIAALILMFMSIFQSFAADTAALEDLLAAYPKELLMAFGMVDVNMSSLLGYYAILFVFTQICVAIQAANYGFGLVSIEEAEWTADFLLTRPVRRPRIMSAKLAAAATALAITDVVIVLASVAFLTLFRGDEPLEWRTLALLLATIPVFQAFFLSVGLAVSLLVRRVRSVTPLSMGLVFGLYILNAFGGMIGERSLEVISPFTQLAPGAIVNEGRWDPLALISVGAIVVAVVAAYVLYARRDIPAAV